jgi:hypothetical protein
MDYGTLKGVCDNQTITTLAMLNLKAACGRFLFVGSGHRCGGNPKAA